MTRQPSPTRGTPTSWAGYKDLARRHYERGDYEAALTAYTSALNPELRCPASEQQIILSNLVACRLKIGGPAQARAAIDNAKQCIALNPQWAKGHVRLASAYIALGGHSNDACNELQRALSIDPGNSTAREMLVRELRRDHSSAASAAAASASSSQSGANNSNNNRSDREGNGSSTNHNNNNNDFSHSDFDHDSPPPPSYSTTMDDSLTFMERLQFHVGRTQSWFMNQSEDVKTIFKIFLVVLLLYVGFGGRFGLGGNHRQMGNYGANNAYDQYRRYGTTESSSSYRHGGDYYGRDDYQRRASSSSSSSSYHRDDYYAGDNHYHHHNSWQPRGGGGGWSIGFGLDPLSMLMLGGLVFGGYRMGINPFHAMLMMNMMGRGGRRGFRPWGGGIGGFGGGMRGMRYRRWRY